MCSIEISNPAIMLDSNFTAKLGDFGLAQLVDHGKESPTANVAETKGYVAPEYITTRKASEGSDVYSFGVVSLEIACGRKAVNHDLESSQVVTVEWAGSGALWKGRSH